MGFLDLDGDGGLLLGGLSSAGQGFIKGMQDAEDRKFKRMEFDAKMKASELEAQRNDFNKRLEARGKGFLVPEGQFDPGQLQWDPSWVEMQTGLRQAGALGDPYGSKALAAEMAKANLRKAEEEAAERAKKKTPAGKVEALSGDQRKRFDDTTGAYDSLLDVKDAYSQIAAKIKDKGLTDRAKGKSEMVDVPLRGDTNFTSARNRFVEFLGRLQSGGAITKDEVKVWTALIPGPMDSPEIAEQKLADLEFRMKARLKGFGVSPEEAQGAGFLKTRGAEGLIKANVKPQAPVLSGSEIEWAD